MDPRSEPQLTTPYRVVIVDDHPLFRAALRSAVCAACATGEFFEADSVATLLDTLERQPGVDLLLLDLNLPGAHGFSALAHLRGAHPELPVVVVSALDDPTTVQQAMALSVADIDRRVERDARQCRAVWQRVGRRRHGTSRHAGTRD